MGDIVLGTPGVTVLSESGGSVSLQNTDISSVVKESIFHGGYKFQSGQGVVTAFSTGTGSQWPFDIELFSKNITMNFSGNTWTHTYTGYYMLTVNYRHQGSDAWTLIAVTKGGASECVGVSGRTGSTSSEEKSRTLMYTVDSTSATYQLQGWCHSGTQSIGVNNTDTNTADGSPTNPTWSFSGMTTAPFGGGTTDPAGLLFGCSIYKVGDL